MTTPQVHFPEEIIRMICDVADKDTLSRLSRVDRALNVCLAGQLWSEFRWNEVAPVVQFLRSIIHKPELSTFVKALDIRLSLWVENGEKFIPAKSIPIQVPESALPWLTGSTPGMDSEWASKIKSGEPSAFVALVIALLPNLETLSLRTNYVHELNFTGSVFKWAFSPEIQAIVSPGAGNSPQALTPWTPWAVGPNPFSAFQNLHTVNIVSVDRDPRMTLYNNSRNKENLLGLFYLPSVEHITAPIDIHGEFKWPCKNPPTAVNLTSLNLAMVREGDLGQILAVTPALEKLEWNWCFRPEINDAEDEAQGVINLKQVFEDLGKVSGTLVDLKITGSMQRLPRTSDGHEGIFPELSDNGELGNLKAFKELENLTIPIVFLLGFSSADPSNPPSLGATLPESVEHLVLTDDLLDVEYIHWDQNEIVGFVQTYLANWRSFTPKLHSLTLQVRWEGTAWIPEGLLDLIAASGVQFNVEQVEEFSRL